MVRLPLLFRKMLRDITRSLPAYLVCGMIVTMGIIGYSVLSITVDNLTTSRDTFYAACKFTDGFVDLRSAPRSIERRINELEGITEAQGRIVLSARVVELPAEAAAELKLYSYTPDGLCRPLLQSGAQPGKNEILLGEGFMQAHGLRIGDSLTLTLEGRRVHLRIAGTALSPEAIYMVKDIADMLPDLSKYDAAYLPYDTISALAGMQQQANSFVFTTDGSRSFDGIKEDLELLLKPYGVFSVYEQKDQVSAAIIEAEITNIGMMSTSVPFLFLGIAAIIMVITLGRLVEQQRVQIGTLMALGLSPQRLRWHYCGYGAVIGLCGGLVGGFLSIFAADAMSKFFRVFFKIPTYGLYVSPLYVVGGVVIATLACGWVAWYSAKGLQTLTPAMALRPPAPPKTGIAPLEKLPGLLWALTVPGRMAVRGLFRNKRKTLLSLIGVACAYMISAALLSLFSLIDVFIFDNLEETQRQDITVTFSKPVSEADAHRAIRSPYIELAEGVTELPVSLIGGERTVDCTLMALSTDAQLYKLYDTDKRRVPVGESGLIISSHMSTLLGVGIGDSLEIKFSYPKERISSVMVTGVIEQYLGSTAYTSREQLGRIADTGGGITSLYIKATQDSGELLSRQLKDVDLVANIQSRADKVGVFRTLMGSFNGIFLAMAMMGVIIGFAVVYTGSLISFEELKREISTLLALGLDSSQAVEVISVGQWLIALGGMILGMPMTAAVSKMISRGMSSDLFSIPDFIDLNSLILAAGLTMVSVWLGTVVLYRRINKMNPVELLRERE